MSGACRLVGGRVCPPLGCHTSLMDWSAAVPGAVSGLLVVAGAFITMRGQDRRTQRRELQAEARIVAADMLAACDEMWIADGLVHRDETSAAVERQMAAADQMWSAPGPASSAASDRWEAARARYNAAQRTATIAVQRLSIVLPAVESEAQELLASSSWPETAAWPLPSKNPAWQRRADAIEKFTASVRRSTTDL